ncbi:MAG: HD domain-containing protein [Patescibacteria group bacterium]
MEFERAMGEREVKMEEVKKVFSELKLNFDIEKYPDLLERLVDTGEHFQDAVEMARMIDAIWDKLEVDDADRETLLTATLFHDIGKSGSLKIFNDSKMREVFIKLFPRENVNIKTHDDLVKSRSINFEDLARNAGFENSDRLIEVLSSEQTPLTKDTPAIVFWRYHADWTYEILKDAGIDEQIVRIASSHHILVGKNPAHLSEEEIGKGAKTLELTDKYHAHGHRVLEMVDKLQATMERGAQKTHEEIIAFLYKIIDDSTVSDNLKNDYREIIEKVFTPNKEIFERIFKKDLHSRE